MVSLSPDERSATFMLHWQYEARHQMDRIAFVVLQRIQFAESPAAVLLVQV